MAAVTICSDFGAQKNKVCHCFHCFPVYSPWSDATRCQRSSFSECWALSQLFHSPLSLSSRDSLVLHCHKGSVICISEVIDISPSNLDSRLCFIQPSVSHDVACIEVKQVGWQYYTLDILLFLFGTSLLFHVHVYMLPDLHIGFSRGRSGGLVFPSLSEFSAVCCDLHSPRLWHSQ